MSIEVLSKVTKARLGWFGHVQRMDSGYTGKRKMQLPGRRRGRGWVM